ncbi:hypothetical protein [Nocardia alni]|uniref:hypothetical protein n=1 Tax=Nocardia alni TaxID=2815723 RepID=UPI001C2394D3|nr:hypothetical protein [Nocardia alni]
MSTDPPSGFVLEDLTVGSFAHGFGTTDDGRPFAFRTVRTILTLEIYRPDLDADVPGPEDVVAVARTPVTDIDLDDARSVEALVCDLLPVAESTGGAHDGIPRESTTVRAQLLRRLGSVIDRSA